LRESGGKKKVIIYNQGDKVIVMDTNFSADFGKTEIDKNQQQTTHGEEKD